MYKRSIILLIFAVCNVELYKVETFPQDKLKLVKDESGKRVLDLRNSPGEDCYRECVAGETRTCYFKFVMEHYQAMGVACGKCAQGVMEDCFHPQCITVDGVERGVNSINRQIPGPPIHVCHGDRIVIDVVNMMSGTATTLHWHGLHMRNTQIYDGVPYITQCPIDFGHTFRYQFNAAEAGTHWYHSHAGHHKINGHFGSLIIRRGDAEPHRQLYNYDLKEHTISITDWIHEDAEMFVPGLPTRKPGINPENLLINGKGVFIESSVPTNTPIEVIKVREGGKYRFRYINGAGHMCPVQFQIQDHNMTIIASDSFDTKPITVDTLISTGGERYDFVIFSNQKPGDYCIKVKLLGNCEAANIVQYGILTYSDTHEVTPSEYAKYGEIAAKCRVSSNIKEESYMNHPNTTCYDPSDKHYCSADLSALNTDLSLLNATVDQKFYIAFNNYLVTKDEMFETGRYEYFLNPAQNRLVQSALNNISFAFPSFTLLTQTDQLSDDIFCDEGNLPQHCTGRRFCHCTHRAVIKLNSVVELILVDENRVINRMNHPFHMHGYGLTVTDMSQVKGMEMTVDLYKELERTGKLTKMPDNHIPPIKDTISIPSAGYTTVRFRADNPGFWLLHCHFDHHLATGMTLLLQVGTEKDFPQPPANFPKCNNFIPDVYEEFEGKSGRRNHKIFNGKS